MEIIIILGMFLLVLGIIVPVFRNMRDREYRKSCCANLAKIGMAMLVYANDYEGQLPRAGGRDTAWGGRVVWDATDRFSAFSLSADGTGGFATISSSFYLLVKYAETTPKSFICKGDIGATEFRLSDYPSRNPIIRENIDAWDFGDTPRKHCSYSYHQPYGQYALTASSEPGMAVAADRNPWIATPFTEARANFTNFIPDTPPLFVGTAKQAKYGNTQTHQNDGQNVLFMDSHVSFEMRPYCGIDDDNIYTFLPAGIGHPQLGLQPFPFVSQPGHGKDSLLVHDGEPTAARVRPAKRR